MTEQSQTTWTSSNRYLWWIGLLLIFFGLTLPFHYVPSALKMFPKDHFTFKHTIITQDDVDDVIKRYNNASNIFEQNAMNSDPFIRTLREQGIVVDKSKKDKEEDEFSESRQTSYHSINSEVAFLASYNEKYPYDVNLLENPTIKKRLRSLIGNRFAFLKETWAVETPIKVEHNTFVASACQAHNCAATNFIIVVNLESNTMYVGIREEETLKTYSEDGTTSSYIEEWKKQN
jgi:hypothetical protein